MFRTGNGWRAALAIGFSLAGAPAPAEHLVAVVATKGSPHQPHGDEVIAGAEAAIGRVNGMGGVLGQPLRLVAWSEDCTRERAQQIAEEVARLEPAVVIGHLCAGAALAAAPIYAKAGVLLIAPGVRHPGLTAAVATAQPGAAPLVLRLAGRDDRFAAETVRFIGVRHPGERVALVADRTKQAKALAAAIATELTRQKVPLALDERIESAERSYDAVAGRIRASGAGVVIVPAQPIELGAIAASLRRAGGEATIVGSEVLAVPSMTATARREGGRLVLMLPWTGTESFVAEPRSHGEPASVGQGLAVRLRAEAAVEVWAGAARGAGSADAAQVAAATRSATIHTVIGPIRFDAAGDAEIPSYVPHTWRDEAWQPLPPPS